MAKVIFPAAKLSDAVHKLENVRPSIMDEIRYSPAARINVEHEIENLKYEIAQYERAIERAKNEKTA